MTVTNVKLCNAFCYLCTWCYRHSVQIQVGTRICKNQSSSRKHAHSYGLYHTHLYLKKETEYSHYNKAQTKKIRDNNINSNSVVQISHACIVFIVDGRSAPKDPLPRLAGTVGMEMHQSQPITLIQKALTVITGLHRPKKTKGKRPKCRDLHLK